GRRRPARLLDQGRDVLDLALRGVRLRVVALIATAAVVGIDREPWRERLREPLRRDKGAAAERAIDKDDARAAARFLVRDHRPILGSDLRRHHRSFCTIALHNPARERTQARLAPPAPARA